MDTTETTAPAPTPAQVFRDHKYWTFTAGPGLHIRCRHLPFDECVFMGIIPLPVLQVMGSSLKPGESLRQALADTERRETLVETARFYASKAAVAPRISLLPSDDPDVLVVGGEDPDLSDAVLVQLMNEGAGRRLGVDLQTAAIFRAGESTGAVADRPDGASIQPAPEQLAAAGAGPGSGA